MNAGKIIYDTHETAFAVDRKEQIAAWNEAAVNTLGHTAAEALGQPCWELLSGQDVFGNLYCRSDCPLRVMAFDGQQINRFQVDFETATHTRKRFSVSLLTLSAGAECKLMIHLCHPVPVPDADNISRKTNPSTATIKYTDLSPREITVLSHLHKGESVTQVSTALNISTSTVRNHTQHVLKKLRVHTRLQAVILGRELGLI